MDFVQNDELVLVAGELELGIGELGPFGWKLQVEIYRKIAFLISNHHGHGGFADLSGAEQDNRREGTQRLSEPSSGKSWNHNPAIIPRCGRYTRCQRSNYWILLDATKTLQQPRKRIWTLAYQA